MTGHQRRAADVAGRQRPVEALALPNAACRDPMIAPLFQRPLTTKTTRAAKAVCGRCPDRPECLAWALEHEPYGFWGGHGQAELNLIRNEFESHLEEI